MLLTPPGVYFGLEDESNPYGAAASAAALPATAVFFARYGTTLADADTTVDQWAALYGGATGVFSPLVAPAAANRPAYSAAGGEDGLPMLVFNGTDDALRKASATAGAVWTSWEAGFVGELHTDGANGDQAWTIGGGTIGERRLYEEIGALHRLRADDATPALITSTSTTTYTTRGHRSADWATGGNQNVRFARTIEDADANNRVSYADGPEIVLGSSPALATFGAYNFMAFHISYRQLLADERAYLGALLEFHTGVAS